MSSAVGKKIPPRRRTPASSLPDGFLRSTGFSAVVSVQSVLLNDQANVMFTGLGESILKQADRKCSVNEIFYLAKEKRKQHGQEYSQE